MGKCGCSGDSCSCKIVAGRGTRVSGSGNINNPYVIDAYPMSLTVLDSTTIDLSLTGSGLESDPWIITAEVADGFFDDFWKMWSGTQEEYDDLEDYDDGTLYIITPEP